VEEDLGFQALAVLVVVHLGVWEGSGCQPASQGLEGREVVAFLVGFQQEVFLVVGCSHLA
jgi:hypothetical protein